MRLLLVVLLGLGTGACVKSELALPDDPLSQAATCSAVRALELRQGGSETPSFEGFTEILHFAMIAAAADDVQVDLRRLVTVTQRAPDVMAEIQDKAWPTLIEPCNAAFPQSQRNPAPLQPDPYEAGMTCFAMADFVAKTAVDYPDAQRRAAAISGQALAAAQPVLQRRARSDAEAERIVAGYAARAFKAGRPAAFLAQCGRRFPPPPAAQPEAADED
mgnify:CR=1 FL=1